MPRNLFSSSGKTAHCPAAIVSPLRAVAICSVASGGHRDAILPAWGTWARTRASHCCASWPSLETSPFFPMKHILMGGWVGRMLTRWPGTDWRCNAGGVALRSFFLWCSSLSTSRHSQSTAGPSTWFCFPDPSIPLSCLAPGLSLFLFTWQREEVKKTWYSHSSQPLPSPDVEQSCQGKEHLAVIFQTPLFISHSFDKLLTLAKIHSISMLERNDKSLKVWATSWSKTQQW